MFQTPLRKWRNSMRVIIPTYICEKLNLKEDDKFTITITARDHILLTKVKPKPKECNIHELINNLDLKDPLEYQEECVELDF